jgi:hypothetical protein
MGRRLSQRSLRGWTIEGVEQVVVGADCGFEPVTIAKIAKRA